jgi:aspartate/methionine/tyrosine aminotransferase
MLHIDRTFRVQGRHVGAADGGRQCGERLPENGFIRRADPRHDLPLHRAELTATRPISCDRLVARGVVMRQRSRPQRLEHLHGIGVDRMGAIGDSSGPDLLRLENLDTDIPPDPQAIARTRDAIERDVNNSYLPFLGHMRLREAAARHVSNMSGNSYAGDRNCIVSAGGLSGILNVLLATVDVGDEVIVTDPTYIGLTNRVRLVGGIPKHVPFVFNPGGTWTFDRARMRDAVRPQTTAMLLMSPSMPSGGYLDENDWQLVADLCRRHDLLLILDAAMERLVFDGRAAHHPASLPGMAERTIIVGSSAKELRMIGWRVGWIVAPEPLIPDLAAVSLANVVTPVGLAQEAVATALENSATTIGEYVDALQARRDTVFDQLRDLPVGVPAGGWSLLMRVADFGIDGDTMSQRLLQHGVCATSMRGWGVTHGEQYVRFVYSNEPVARLRLLGDRVRAALAAYK